MKFDGSIGSMLERFNRDLKDSDAWRGFTKLIDIYRKNGVPYTNLGSGEFGARQTAQANFHPNVCCIYDQTVYKGYFESLEYTEAEDNPHSIKYSFSFTYLSSLDLSKVGEVSSMLPSSIDSSVYNAGALGLNNLLNNAAAKNPSIANVLSQNTIKNLLV